MNRMSNFSRFSEESGILLEDYKNRYQQINPKTSIEKVLQPYEVQEAFQKYLTAKVNAAWERKKDPALKKMRVELEKCSSLLSQDRLNHIAYWVHCISFESQITKMFDSKNMSCLKAIPHRFFAISFHQMENASLRWQLASILPDFQAHFEETLNTHPLNEEDQEINQMEQDLLEIPQTSLFKQHLIERRALDKEGRLLRAETPLETKQNMHYCFRFLAHLLKLSPKEFEGSDLKSIDEAVSKAVHARFSMALDKNPKWRKSLSGIQSSDLSASEKIERIKTALSKESQVQTLKRSLSLEVTEEDLSSFFSLHPALGSIETASHSSLQAFEVLSNEVIDSLKNPSPAQILSAVRSKVEGLCRAIGASTPLRYSVYELYSSYLQAFKEACSEMKNPLHVLLAKEAHLKRDEKMLEQIRPKLPPLDTSSPTFEVRNQTSPLGSARTSNESPVLEVDPEFQAFILEKGLLKKAETREYKELLSFTREIYENPVKDSLELTVELWTQKSRTECFKWLSGAFFVNCLNENLIQGNNDSLESVLEDFGWQAEKELERLGLPCIYSDMLASSLVSGNVRRLKLVADEIAYARYCEAHPHEEPPSFKTKTIAEKIESTKNYLKKMKNRAQAGYLLSHMESFSIKTGEVSEATQIYLDKHLKGDYKENRFYQYLEKGKFEPLSFEMDKRLPYLFYIQHLFIKELEEKAQRSKTGAALVYELTNTGFLDFGKLDRLAASIESGKEVDIDSCIKSCFYAAVQMLFINNLLNDPSFDVVTNFINIKNLSEQKALLDELEKGGYEKAINTIILKGTIESYSIGYEWLRDRIEVIPREEFMLFFLRYFTVTTDISRVLEIRSEQKASYEEFQNAIKQDQFLESPIRKLLEREQVIDENGDLIWVISFKDVMNIIDHCLLIQKDFLKMNVGSDVIGKSEKTRNWFSLLTKINSAMNDALKSGISLDCTSEQVEAMIRTATHRAVGNSIFSDHLKELKLDSIQGLSPREQYDLYISYINELSKYFGEKVTVDLGMEFWSAADLAIKALRSNVRMENWDAVNANAKKILIIKSIIQQEKTDWLSEMAYSNASEHQNVPIGFIQQSLKDPSKDLLETAESNIDSIATQDRANWIKKVNSSESSTIDWLNGSPLSSLMSEINTSTLSILEKRCKTTSVMKALAKVLNQEFERLGMSPSYKDLIERAFLDSNGSLLNFLMNEVSHRNYQQELEKIRGQQEDSLIPDELKPLFENELLQKKMPNLNKYSKEFLEYPALREALDSDRLAKLVKNELESNQRSSS